MENGKIIAHGSWSALPSLGASLFMPPGNITAVGGFNRDRVTVALFIEAAKRGRRAIIGYRPNERDLHMIAPINDGVSEADAGRYAANVIMVGPDGSWTWRVWPAGRGRPNVWQMHSALAGAATVMQRPSRSSWSAAPNPWPAA